MYVPQGRDCATSCATRPYIGFPFACSSDPNPAIAALVARLKSAGRLKPKQLVVAAMRKLLVICFGVLKTGQRFDPAIAMPA